MVKDERDYPFSVRMDSQLVNTVKMLKTKTKLPIRALMEEAIEDLLKKEKYREYVKEIREEMGAD